MAKARGLHARFYERSFLVKNTSILALAFVLLLGAALLPGTHAQNDASKPRIGTVNVDFDKAGLDPGLWHLTGHARLTADDYDLAAADIQVRFAPGGKPGASGLREAVAAGSAPEGQVLAHVRQPLQSASYEIHADRAVFLPDRSRPSGGALKFAGHVKVITKSGFLAAPSVATTDEAIVLLGAGPKYPSVSTGPGHLTLTPAQ